MSNFPLWAQRLVNTPLMLRPDKIEMIAAVVYDRIGLISLDGIDGTTLGAAEMRAKAQQGRAELPARGSGYSAAGDIAVVSFHGTCAQRVAGLEPDSGMIGYNQIEKKIAAAQSDPEVGGVLVSIDTPGGEAAGAFESAKRIAKMGARAGGKPIFGYADEMCCSAGYALMSAFDMAFMPEGGIVGSIGVWSMLVDKTEALEQAGIKAKIIRAGDRKARGGAYEVADKETVDKLFASVEHTRDLFAGMVAKNRGLSKKKILDTEGDWFHEEDALKLGLIDGVGPIEAVAAALQRRVRK